MNMRSRRWWRTAGAAVLATGVLAGCGGTGDGGGEGGGEGGGDGAIVAASNYPIVGLDPHGTLAADLGTAVASKAIYDTLLAREGERYVPRLATRWTANEDSTEWTFELRDGVTFTDGSELTSEDVKASVQRLVSGEGPLAPLWADVDVRTPDPRTVVFEGEQGLGSLLANLTVLRVLPSEGPEQEAFFDKPVGSGPFKVESFKPNQELRLVANPDHWGAKAKLERLTFRVIPEISARLTALETGEVDVSWGMPDDQLTRLEGLDELETGVVPSYSSYVVWFNSSDGPLAKADVRRALWHAVNVPEIVRSLNPQTGTVAKAPLAPAVLGSAAQPPYPYDPARAKQLLADAGYPDGFETAIQWSGAEPRQFVQAMISDWAKVGVRVTPQEKEKAVWLEDLVALDWDMNFMAQTAATGDPSFLLGRLYPCDAKRIGYCNERLDRILAQAGSTGEQAERNRLYAQAQSIIWRDAVGIYPMDQRIPYVWRTSVTGFAPDPNFAPDFSSVAER